MRNNKYTIAIDFDGTCVTHKYPHVGRDIGAVPVLKELVGNGHKLILYTMRSGVKLDEAVKWFKDNDIPLKAVNDNPVQHHWTNSPKVYADMYIDDAALGIPKNMVYGEELIRPYVDWVKVREMLTEMGLL